jgi:hypothetical protein
VRNSVALLNSLHKTVEEARISPSGSGSCEMGLPKSWGHLGTLFSGRSENLQRKARMGEYCTAVHWRTALLPACS